MAFSLWPTLLLLFLGISFYYFVLAGGRTFEHGPGDEWAAGLAQFSFLVTGLFGTMFLGFRAAVPVANGIAGGALMAAALGLYEWARRTVSGRRFHIAWSGEMPDSICRDGPYRYVRHPVYLSYMIAFLAMLAALPGIPALAIFVFNVALFAHAARQEEKALEASGLAAYYAGYKRTAGMFLPRLRQPPK